METESGEICAELIRDFLECYRMDYTLQIFVPECNLPPESKMRDKIANQYGLKQENAPTRKPLLMQILQIMQERSGLPNLKEAEVPPPAQDVNKEKNFSSSEKKPEIVKNMVSSPPEEANSAKKDVKKEEESLDDLFVFPQQQKPQVPPAKEEKKEDPALNIRPKKSEPQILPPEPNKPVNEQLPPLSIRIKQIIYRAT
jgi:hypothetical protein